MGVIRQIKDLDNATRVQVPCIKKESHTCGIEFCLVRVMGLEPIRHKHTPLKRACLPIPAHSQKNNLDALLRRLIMVAHRGIEPLLPP